MMSFLRITTVAVAVAVVNGAPMSGQSTRDSVIAPQSGDSMCQVLEPPDFSRVGLTVADPKATVDDEGASVYCTYPNPSGKVELDVFYGAKTTAPAAIQIERVTMSEVGGLFKPVSLEGADDAQMASGGSGASAVTSIVFRRGTAVLSLAIPTTPRASDQLLALAGIAVGRIHRA